MSADDELAYARRNTGDEFTGLSPLDEPSQSETLLALRWEFSETIFVIPGGQASNAGLVMHVRGIANQPAGSGTPGGVDWAQVHVMIPHDEIDLLIQALTIAKSS